MYPFHYRNKGELAMIGRSRAVASLPGNIKISGWLAWLFYLGVHLFYLARTVPEEPPATASEIAAHPASPPLH